MTPIERAQTKTKALSTLGLGSAASFAEIRRAWHRRAFETHPDTASGDLEAFERAKAAFELLKTEAEHSPCDGQPATICQSGARITPRRPTTAGAAHIRIDSFSPEDQQEGSAVFLAHPDAEATDHVAEAIHRQGRHLVYVVASEIAPGLNRVALPAQFLVTNRKVAPSIVSFRVKRRTFGVIVIPEEKRLEVFPGARSVRIRFESERFRH